MRISAFLVASFVFLVSADAEQPTPPQQLARQYFQEGKRLFVAERYEHALAAFRQAHAHRPLPDILFMIGQCHRNLGQYADAIRSFEGYLKGKPHADDRQQVEMVISRLKQKLPAPEEPESAPTAAPPVEVKPSLPPQPLLPTPTAPAQTAPLHKRWWFWAVVGGAVAVAVGAGIAIGYGANSAPESPTGSLGTLDLR